MIGVGNRWRGDDGAGPAVAAAVGGVCTDEPAGLLDLWAGAAHAIVVDAAAPSGRPGAVSRFDAVAGPLPAGVTRCSTHAFGVAEAIELARALDRLPPRLDVYAIEGEDFTVGERLTPAVQRAAGALAAALG